jgi:hypothetical protein
MAPSQETLAALAEVVVAPPAIANRSARSSGRTAELTDVAEAPPAIANRFARSSGRTAELVSCVCWATVNRSDLSSGLTEICMLFAPGIGLAAAGAANAASETPIARRRSHRLLRFVIVLLPITVNPLASTTRRTEAPVSSLSPRIAA